MGLGHFTLRYEKMQVRTAVDIMLRFWQNRGVFSIHIFYLFSLFLVSLEVSGQSVNLPELYNLGKSEGLSAKAIKTTRSWRDGGATAGRRRGDGGMAAVLATGILPENELMVVVSLVW